MCRKWKKAEKEELRRLLEGGTQLQDVEIPGRNYEGIRRQAGKLGLTPRLMGAAWTFRQELKLAELRAQGIPPKKIAELNLLGPPERTAVALYKACTRLGLAGENRSLASRNRKIWRQEEKQEFIAFLVQRSKTLASEQIAEKFGLKKGTVEAWQRRLGIKLKLQETLALPRIRNKMQEVYRRKSQKMLAEFEQGSAKKQEEFEVLSRAIRRKKRALPFEEKRCPACGRVWPRHKRFFYYSVTRVNGYTGWRFFSRCKICIDKQRHAKNVLRHQKKYGAEKRAV